MISDDRFNEGLDLLESHYSKSLSEDVIGIWREYLDNELDDKQFITAVKEAILSCEFMPTPKKLVEMATKSLEVKAMEEWSQVVKWSGYSREHQQKAMSSFSDRCRMALQIVGGLGVVGFAENYELARLEKKFVLAYCQCSPDARALPPAKIPPITFEAEPEPPKNFHPSNLSIKKILHVLSMQAAGKEISEQQLALNMFVNKWKWQIDPERLNYYLSLSQEAKQQFQNKFGYAMRHSPSWKSAVTNFDRITGYQAPPPEIDSQAIAKEWLKEEMN